MALNKKITDENGTYSAYHKISSISLDSTDESMNLTIIVKSFLNKKYREKNSPVRLSSYTFEIPSDEDNNVGIRALGYNKLKTLELFKDAEDC